MILGSLEVIQEEARAAGESRSSRNPGDCSGNQRIERGSQTLVVGVCVRSLSAYERVLRLENRRPRKGTDGSNPSLSANSFRKRLIRKEFVHSLASSPTSSPTFVVVVLSRRTRASCGSSSRRLFVKSLVVRSR